TRCAAWKSSPARKGKRPSPRLRGKATFKVVFAGTAPFAVPSLRALHQAGHEISLVITQPDRPGHRNRVTPSAVKAAAVELGLPIYQPERIRDPEPLERLHALAP